MEAVILTSIVVIVHDGAVLCKCSEGHENSQEKQGKKKKRLSKILSFINWMIIQYCNTLLNS